MDGEMTFDHAMELLSMSVEVLDRHPTEEERQTLAKDIRKALYILHGVKYHMDRDKYLVDRLTPVIKEILGDLIKEQPPKHVPVPIDRDLQEKLLERIAPQPPTITSDNTSGL